MDGQVDLAALQSFAQQRGLALTVTDPSPEELPPTLLKNPTAVAGAEGVMTFYMTPSYRAWDPTWVLYISFAVFFCHHHERRSLQLVDGIVLAVFWRRLSASEQARKTRNLFAGIVVPPSSTCRGRQLFWLHAAGLDRLQWKLDGQPLVNNRDAMMICPWRSVSCI